MVSYNIRFPLRDDVSTNSFLSMTQISKDALSSDLLLLLLTKKGERFYEHNYGTNLTKYIFEPNDSITQQDIEQEIKQTVSRYIPTVTIDTVDFQKIENDDTELNVHIEFTYTEDTFTEQGSLDLNF